MKTVTATAFRPTEVREPTELTVRGVPVALVTPLLPPRTVPKARGLAAAQRIRALATQVRPGKRGGTAAVRALRDGR